MFDQVYNSMDQCHTELVNTKLQRERKVFLADMMAWEIRYEITEIITLQTNQIDEYVKNVLEKYNA